MNYLEYIPKLLIPFEPIRHARADEAEARGMTVEQLLALEKAQAEALKNQGVIIADKGDAYQNKMAAIKGNPKELQRQEEGKQKAYAEAGKAANAMLGLSMPSGWWNLTHLDNLLTDGQATAMDLGAIALLGGIGLVKGAIGKNVALKELENTLAKEMAEKSAAETSAKNSIAITNAGKKTFDKTAFFYEPGKGAKVSTLPKGQQVPHTLEENIAFRNQINDFANKYGYEPIGTEVTDPEVLERYARSMIKKHNTFYRGVEGANDAQKAIFATNVPGGGAGELYITPYEGIAGMYGDPVEILRPYKLGPDRTKWFDEGNFRIASAGGLREMENFENVKGIVNPWIDNLRLSLENKIVPTELTGRNLKFIPLRVRHRVPYGTIDWVHSNNWLQGVGSLLTTTVPFTPNVLFKSGGKLNYLNYLK